MNVPGRLQSPTIPGPARVPAGVARKGTSHDDHRRGQRAVPLGRPRRAEPAELRPPTSAGPWSHRAASMTRCGGACHATRPGRTDAARGTRRRRVHRSRARPSPSKRRAPACCARRSVRRATAEGLGRAAADRVGHRRRGGHRPVRAGHRRRRADRHSRAGRGRRPLADRTWCGAQPPRSVHGWVLEGVKNYVVDGASAGLILVVALAGRRGARRLRGATATLPASSASGW
jgi:hypothetical protein